MKKIIEKLQAAEQKDKHQQATEAKINYQHYLAKNESAINQGNQQINREKRKFLDVLGKVGISSGALKASTLIGGIFANRYAQAAGGPKRVFYCYIDSGAHTGSWLPSSATGMNTVTKAYGPEGSNVASICHFRQINVEVTGHSAVVQALGAASGGQPLHGVPTMDARIAPLLSANTPYKALYLGSDATTTQGALCSTIGPCIDDPATAYKTYFNSALPVGSTDETYLKVFAAQQRALQQIRNKLGQDEKVRLDAHSQALTDLEKRITAIMSGEGPDIETYRPTLPPASNYAGKVAEQGKIQGDIIIAALQAGLTNVGVLQLGNHQGTWKGDGTNFRGTLHDAAHNNQVPIGRDFSEMIGHLSKVPAYLIKRLMETEDSDGQKMIENTVFVQVTCMGNGVTHDPANAPFLVATRMPGFKQGFSAATTGNTQDFNGAIPKGLGLAAGSYAAMGSGTLGLI
jgi:hypothetical protein